MERRGPGVAGAGVGAGAGSGGGWVGAGSGCGVVVTLSSNVTVGSPGSSCISTGVVVTMGSLGYTSPFQTPNDLFNHRTSLDIRIDLLLGL